jgi:hypothetical protein
MVVAAAIRAFDAAPPIFPLAAGPFDAMLDGIRAPH